MRRRDWVTIAFLAVMAIIGIVATADYFVGCYLHDRMLPPAVSEEEPGE